RSVVPSTPQAGARRRVVGSGAHRLAAGGQEVLGYDGSRHRAAQSLGVDPGAAFVIRGLAGVVGCRGQASLGRVPVHDRSAVLARGIAGHIRRGAAHLLLLHGADLRRAPVGHACNLVAGESGGRVWTTLAAWSLMIRAVGIGYAVQNPDTPYFIFLGLALLCGFGGGNF